MPPDDLDHKLYDDQVTPTDLRRAAALLRLFKDRDAASLNEILGAVTNPTRMSGLLIGVCACAYAAAPSLESEPVRDYLAGLAAHFANLEGNETP